MNEIILDGCTPTPLASYLKALGVLRLLSTKYPATRGFWRGDHFVLRSPLDRDGITRFFLEDYEPTPLVAPWGARSGFYEGSAERTAREALSRIATSKNKQLQPFREMIHVVRDLLSKHGINEKAADDKKLELLRICRGELPDHLLEWLDVCYVLTGDTRKFPPLLGTGGNEGSGSYVSGFSQQVVACFIDGSHSASLATSLYGCTIPEGVVDQTPGHFSPSDTGGLNATVGFEDNKARTNPWEYILALEGTLALAGSAVRRHADDPSSQMSFPFTVHATFAGSGSLGEGDANKPRGEMWLPLWQQPSSYPEIHTLMAEGRVAFGKKPARDALDFVRAVHHFGSYRGIRAFERFGILKRNGKSYFSMPLARIEVRDETKSPWLDELDHHGWLERFQRFANDANAATRFKTLRKLLEDTLFALSGREPSKAETQALLALLGEIQSALSSSKKALENARPIPHLSERWVQAAADGSAAFRIAKALAGLRGASDQPLPLRAQLFPLHRRFDQWMTPNAGEKVRIYTGQQGHLVDTLHHLLERRLWLAERLEMHDKPLNSPAGATLEDLAAFLYDDSMDARIDALLPGLALCDIPQDTDRTTGDGAVPPAFGLLKLCLIPDRTLHSLRVLRKDQRMPVPAGMLAQLAAGNHDNRAVKTAWRRLYATGLAPLFAPSALPSAASIHPQRACAALLIPLRYGASAALARHLLRPAPSATEVA